MVILSDKDDNIIASTPVYEGRSHDKGIFNEEKLEELLPENIPVYVDTGFEGIGNNNPKLKIKKPKKKPKGRKLNGGEKLGNRIISSKRVKVEHAIGRAKIFKMLSGIWRCTNRCMNKVVRISISLANYQRKMSLQKS